MSGTVEVMQREDMHAKCGGLLRVRIDARKRPAGAMHQDNGRRCSGFGRWIMMNADLFVSALE